MPTVVFPPNLFTALSESPTPLIRGKVNIQSQTMKKEFETFKEGLAWIALHAISQFHLNILSEELSSNHRFTGHYFIHTIMED